MEFKFLASYILILLALYYSKKEHLGLGKDILVNSLRAFIQLLILGYILVYVFRLRNFFELLFIVFCMVLFAAFTAQKRVTLVHKGFFVSFLSLFASSFLVLLSLISLQVISFKPNEIIPIGGMIVGNSLNIYTLVIDRLKGEVKNTIDIVESMISLGATLKQALLQPIKASVKAALIPTINSLQTVGIIHIPGIATGMLIAGAEPLEAVSYQLVIMYMMVAVALFTGFFTILFSYKHIISTIAKNY